MFFKVTLVAALSCAALAVPSHYGTSAGGQGGDSAGFGGITGDGASAGGGHDVFKGFAYSHVNVYRPKTQSVPIFYNYYEAAPQHHQLQDTTSQEGDGGLDAYKTHSALQGYGQKAHSGFSGAEGVGFGGAEAHDGAGGPGEYMKDIGTIQAAEGSFGGAQSSHGHTGQFPDFQEFQAKVGGAGGYIGQVASAGHDQYGQSAGQQTGGHFGLFYPTLTHDQQLHY